MDEVKVKIVLADLLKLEDIKACLLAEMRAGVITPEKGVKLKDLNLWKLVKDTTDKFFEIASSFYKYGMDRIYFELGEYVIMLYLIEPTVGILAIVPSLANRGLLEVALEKAKIEVAKIISGE
jgi:hypothetical protein